MFQEREFKEYERELIQLRRYFHQYPELSGEEVKTSQFIMEYLTNLGLEVHGGLAGTGVIGHLKGKGKGKTIGFRADMDALPIEEKNEVSYRSRYQNKMHACGHDGHMAVTLITAKILSQMSEAIVGDIYFIFQPAEEDLTGGGAKILYQEAKDIFDRMDGIFGFHFWPSLEKGEVVISPNPMMVAGDIFEVTFQGQGGHGANPHQSSDVLLMASNAAIALTTIISRKIEPGHLSTFSVGVLEAGERPNILPDKAVMKGTTRYVDPKMREFFPSKIHQVLKGITDSYSGSYTLDYIYGYPVLKSDPKLVKLVQKAAISLLGEEKVLPVEKPSLTSEDFAVYLEKIPGCYYWVGTRNEKQSHVVPVLHNARFDLDESVLLLALKLYLRISFEFNLYQEEPNSHEGRGLSETSGV